MFNKMHKKERNIRLNWTWVTRQTDELTSLLRHWLPFLFLKFGFLRVSTEYYGYTSHSQIRRKGAKKPASLQPISSLQDFIIHQQFYNSFFNTFMSLLFMEKKLVKLIVDIFRFVWQPSRYIIVPSLHCPLLSLLYWRALLTDNGQLTVLTLVS